MRETYIIGRPGPDGLPEYYSDGFGRYPSWNGRAFANVYTRKAEALRDAKALGQGAYVTLEHKRPGPGRPDPVVTPPARKARPARKAAPKAQAPGGALPVGHIEWLVDRHHVGDSYLAVARGLARRMRANGWPTAARRAALRVAFARHSANRALFAQVTSGWARP